MKGGPSEAAGNNALWNGTFDGASTRPWTLGFDSTRNGRAALTDGELCFTIETAGTRGDNIVLRQRPIALAAGHRYQLRLRTHATRPTRLRPRLSKIGASYTELWAAVVDSDPALRAYTGTFEASADEPSAELAI